MRQRARFINAVLRAAAWTSNNWHCYCTLPDGRVSALSEILPKVRLYFGPRIFSSFSVVNLRTRVVEEGMIGIVADRFNWKIVLRGDFFQSIYLLLIDPGVALAGDE